MTIDELLFNLIKSTKYKSACINFELVGLGTKSASCWIKYNGQVALVRSTNDINFITKTIESMLLETIDIQQERRTLGSESTKYKQ